MQKKIAIFFPGIGYTADKPLLYYSRKLAQTAGYDCRAIDYGPLPQKIRGDREMMQKAYEAARESALKALTDVSLDDYAEVLLVGKSIGTIVAAGIAADNKQLNIRQVLYTPLEETFLFQPADAIAFSGTADPWVGNENSQIAKLCYKNKIQCISLEGANHSLETGNLGKDLEYLKLVMQMTEKFIGRKADDKE